MKKRYSRVRFVNAPRQGGRVNAGPVLLVMVLHTLWLLLFSYLRHINQQKRKMNTVLWGRERSRGSRWGSHWGHRCDCHRWWDDPTESRWLLATLSDSSKWMPYQESSRQTKEGSWWGMLTWKAEAAKGRRWGRSWFKIRRRRRRGGEEKEEKTQYEGGGRGYSSSMCLLQLKSRAPMAGKFWYRLKNIPFFFTNYEVKNDEKWRRG